MLRPTGKSIREDLRRLWVNEGKSQPYVSAFSVLNGLQKSNFDRAQFKFDNALLSWILVIDEFSLWISSISMAMDGGSSEDKRSLVCRFMLGGLASQIHAVRTLVVAGFDVSAKMLVRQIEEQCLLLILIMDDVDLCTEFHRDHEPEASNKFWHRHISKGKIDKKIAEKFSRKNPELGDALSGVSSWFNEERIVLSAASHPSYLASAMTVAAGISSGRGGAGVFGFADAVSIRTLRVLFYQIFRLLFAQKDSFDFFVSQLDRDNPFSVLAGERQSYVYRLLIYVARFHDDLPLSGEFGDEREGGY